MVSCVDYGRKYAFYLMLFTGPANRGVNATAKPVQEGQGDNDCSSR